MNKEITEILDLLESILVKYTLQLMKDADLANKLEIHLTEEMARNLVGKIGSRITFGKEVVDSIDSEKK